MKKDLHPTSYRTVVVQDISNGWQFVTKSTAKTENEYPLLKVHISSASHPFYTGQEKLLDVEGRVDRFKARTEAAKARKEKLANKAAKQAKRSEKSEESTQTKIGDRKYGPSKKSNQSKKAKEQSSKPKEDSKKTDASSEEK